MKDINDITDYVSHWIKLFIHFIFMYKETAFWRILSKRNKEQYRILNILMQQNPQNSLNF